MLNNKKIKKFFKSPSIFFKDYLNKKHPVIRNEILCREEEEKILIEHDLAMESIIDVGFPIDVVYTWVDSNDPEWSMKKNQYIKKNESLLGNHATDIARFSNHNELFYSIKSVEKNLPWVNRIYIVTDKQIPDWYDAEKNNRIKIIDHTDIINKKHLPTFNSHVIEANLHKIEGLSEHFVYFNDDVFVARKLPPGHFFKSNGLASLFISAKSLRKMLSRGYETPTLSASIRSAELLNKRYKFKPDVPLVHTYVPLRKSMFEMAWNNFSIEINDFLANKFRTNEDLNLATFLIPWLSYNQAKATIERDICYYFNIRSRSAKSFYLALKRLKEIESMPHSFCANDFNTNISPDENYSENLSNALKHQFISETEND